MKLPGWIKSAVEFVKIPPIARQVGPPPSAPHEPDSGVPPHDARPNDGEIRPESALDVAPEVEASIEYESQLSVESGGPSAAEPARPINVESESLVSPELEISPGQQEIDRRRDIVRAFFNDYWSSVDDKPASFADRLDLAEGYINERVAAGGEAWQLGPATRKQLGLPPSKKA